MMRSLWSAASGMIAQQTNVDTISNNIANVNTVGYKNEKAEFKSLLYQTLQSETTSANGEQKPISAQVGLGTRTASITSQFTQGSLTESDSDTAFAIDGDGFFQLTDSNGNISYTRNGDFLFGLNANGTLSLMNAEGLYVTSSTGAQITLPAGVTASQVYVSSAGSVMYYNTDGVLTDLNTRIGLYQFNNPSGLEKTSNSRYLVSAASGAALNEATNNNLVASSIKQGYLESSNVQVADEMVNLIVAQRAYELNSKAITTSDTMLEEAVNLKR